MKICINAICKNELANLEPWIKSFDGATYFAILDTGSTDGTWETLQALKLNCPDKFFIAQQVFKPFRFDEARNAAIELVPEDADWIICVDLDERGNPGWTDAFNQLNEQSDDIYNFYRRDVTANYIGQYVPMARIFKNNNKVKWYFPVHETLGLKDDGIQSPYKDLNIYIEHFEDGDPLKWQWYNKLLEKRCEEYPEDSGGVYIVLAYQNYLLHNYTEAWKYMQLARKACNETPKEISTKLGWNSAWIDMQWELYKMSAEKKIAVYAICKNELKFVDEWVKSMSEANYICVLDTGSTDGTYEKLLEYQEKYPDQFRVAQKVITPWRFDVARNESLKLVPEDTMIYICTDLDELLHSGWAKPLREKWIDGKHQRATYKYIWSHLDNGQPGRVFGYNKIHTKDWEWRYPVHELLWHKTKHTENYSNDESLNLFNEITLEHFPDLSKSRGSYLGLLELREKDYPEDMYGLIYLAHEYRYRGFLDKSIEKLNKVLTVYDHEIASVERASCYLFMGDNYTDLKKYQEAIASYLKGIEVEPTYREPYLNLAKVFIIQKQYSLAIDIIKEGLAKSYRHYTWLERDTSWSFEPYDLLCLAYYYGGHKLESLGCAYKALQFEPQNARLQNNVQLVINSMTEKDY